MRQPGVILCAVPAACWTQKVSNSKSSELLRRFIQESEVIERRLKKGDLSGEESTRYSRLCGRIEAVALSNATFSSFGQSLGLSWGQKNFPALRVGCAYYALIRAAGLKNESTQPEKHDGLGRSIFSPDQVKLHREAFAKAAERFDFQHDSDIRDRLWFLDSQVIRKGCGLVEFPDVLSPPLANIPDADPFEKFKRLLAEKVNTSSEWFFNRLYGAPKELPLPDVEKQASHLIGPTNALKEPEDWRDYGRSDRGRFMKGRLRTQLENSIQDGSVVNLMNQRQNMAIAILQEFVHRQDDIPQASVPVTYSDGGEPKPIPLHSIARLPDGWNATRNYHIGLISMRHLQIDQYIDLNWYRNVDVPALNGLSAADDFCYEYSLKQFEEFLTLNQGHRVRMHLYHTGYMPAVIGFYRALLTTLSAPDYAAGSLQVIPKLQPNNDNGFTEGLPWPM